MEKYAKEYYIKNRERNLINHRKWRQNNRHKTREYDRKRYREDIQYRILVTLRQRVRSPINFYFKANK